MKKIIIILVIALLLLAGVTFIKNKEEETQIVSEAKHFESGDYGISFAYPENYVLEEKDTNDLHRGHHIIILMDEVDYARMHTEPIPSEGPIAITIDIFQNNLDQQSLIAFVTGTNDSNWKLSNGTYSSTTISRNEALTYAWSGLYGGESVVFAHNGNIIMASVTYLTPDDQIRKDFDSVLDSMKFTLLSALPETDAISFVQGMFPELAEFSKDTLPPKSIKAIRREDMWYVIFQIEGSGVPYILSAVCYSVTDSKEVNKTGEYKHPTGNSEGTNNIDPITCASREQINLRQKVM